MVPPAVQAVKRSFYPPPDPAPRRGITSRGAWLVVRRSRHPLGEEGDCGRSRSRGRGRGRV